MPWNDRQNRSVGNGFACMLELPTMDLRAVGLWEMDVRPLPCLLEKPPLEKVSELMKLSSDKYINAFSYFNRGWCRILNTSTLDLSVVDFIISSVSFLEKKNNSN